MNKSDDLLESRPKTHFSRISEITPEPVLFTHEMDQKPYFPSVLGDRSGERNLDFQLLDTFLMGKSLRTQESYLRIVSELFQFISPTSLRDLSLGSLKAFLEMKNYQAHESRRLRASVVKSLFSYACKTGYLPANVASFLPKMEAHHKISERYLTQEEVIGMIAMTRKVRDQVILKVLYTAGLRLSELIALHWEHVQEREKGEGQLLILGKGNKKRVVVLSSGVFEALLKLKKEDTKLSDGVFTSREDGNSTLSKRAVQIIVDKARLKASITKRVTPHWLRHAHASHALDRGAPIHLVQATLGHASVATTGKYLHARPQESSSKYLDF